MSRPLATTITFFISALAHELVMGCITRKFRGYGFIAMMLQMPIVLVQRSKFVRGRTLLNNVLFWCSMILGLAMVSHESHEKCLLKNQADFDRCALFTCLCDGMEAWIRGIDFGQHWCFCNLADSVTTICYAARLDTPLVAAWVRIG